MTLSVAERAKFAAYLEGWAKDTEMLAEQFENSGKSSLPGSPFALKYRVEAKAALIVASILRQTERA